MEEKLIPGLIPAMDDRVKAKEIRLIVTKKPNGTCHTHVSFYGGCDLKPYKKTIQYPDIANPKDACAMFFADWAPKFADGSRTARLELYLIQPYEEDPDFLMGRPSMGGFLQRTRDDRYEAGWTERKIAYERDMIFDKKRNLCLEEGLAELKAHMEICVREMFGTEE